MSRKNIITGISAILLVVAVTFLSWKVIGVWLLHRSRNNEPQSCTLKPQSGSIEMESECSSILTAEQKEVVVDRLVERLNRRPWEFGECGEYIRKIVEEVTNITITESQKSLLEEIFWSAVERLRKLDDLKSEERRLFDFYNQYLQNFSTRKKPPIEEAEKSLGMSFTTENRIHVARKFLFRAVAMPVLRRSEERIWDFIVNEAKASGKTPALSKMESELGISRNEIKEALQVFRDMGFLKDVAQEDRFVFSECIAGPIASEARGLITEVILKDGRKRRASCAINALGMGFSIGEQDFVIEARDPYSGEEIRVEIKDGQISFYEPQGTLIFNGGSCPNINFFTSEENLRKWRVAHPDIEGEIMSLEEALEYGKKVLAHGIQ